MIWSRRARPRLRLAIGPDDLSASPPPSCDNPQLLLGPVVWETEPGSGLSASFASFALFYLRRAKAAKDVLRQKSLPSELGPTTFLFLTVSAKNISMYEFVNDKAFRFL